MYADLVAFLSGLLHDELALALALGGLTAALVICCVPGTIVPMSISSGALLGGWQGAAAVTAGALLGSQALFLLSRHLLRERMRARMGPRAEHYDRKLARHGMIYLVVLRLAGAPHPVVTIGCALSSVRARTFFAATLIGLVPVIALTSAAGSLV